MFLFASLIVFVIFFTNVAVGAFWGQPFFGDVTEMLVLFCATILFVIAILQRERARQDQSKD